ncbi:MAG: RsmD family RNA methyltransferase [Prevotella sp.]|nr:RsmD family RNA methyltransferase [Prevotella sp.]
MRIITGKYKGRRFDIPRTFKARPTTDFAKENIFNVIGGYIDFEDCRALDLFAGTGSISLELLSRGCSQVVSVELDRDHARFISECIRKIGADNHTLLRTDALRYLKKASLNLNAAQQQLNLEHGSTALEHPDWGQGAFNFIFADPPYALPQLPEIPDLVLSSGLLDEGGLFVFEHGQKNNFADHPRFVEHRAYGSVNFSLFA